MSSLAVPHVTLPSSFREDLRKLMLDIAASTRSHKPLAQWAPAWGFAETDLSALAEMIAEARRDCTAPLRSAMLATDSSGAPCAKKAVSFAVGEEAVGVLFFDVGALPSEPPTYTTTAGMKAFDGPSGHKMGRSVREGDADDWEEISRLMALPRGAVCWSHTW